MGGGGGGWPLLSTHSLAFTRYWQYRVNPLLPIFYVEWQNRGLGGKPYTVQCRLQHTRGATKEVSGAKNSIDSCTIPGSANEQTFPSVSFHRCRCVSVKCVERVLSVLEARVNVCRGESLRRLELSFRVTYAQKEKPLDLFHYQHTPSLVGGQESEYLVKVNPLCFFSFPFPYFYFPRFLFCPQAVCCVAEQRPEPRAHGGWPGRKSL